MVYQRASLQSCFVDDSFGFHLKKDFMRLSDNSSSLISDDSVYKTLNIYPATRPYQFEKPEFILRYTNTRLRSPRLSNLASVTTKGLPNAGECDSLNKPCNANLV